jgi:hypothetical protein
MLLPTVSQPYKQIISDGIQANNKNEKLLVITTNDQTRLLELQAAAIS